MLDIRDPVLRVMRFIVNTGVFDVLNMRRHHVLECCVLIGGLLFSTGAGAYQLLAGVSGGYRQLTITSKDRQHRLAELRTKGISLVPSLSVQRAPAFFGHSRWGWTCSSNIFLSGFNDQVVTQNHQLEMVDYNTQISGISVFVTPVVYYQFAGTGTWTWRLGAGLGLGYQNHRGEFIVTDTDSDYVGKQETLRISTLGGSAGIYLEATAGNHHFILNADSIAPITPVHGEDFDYYYAESAVYLTYAYAFAQF